jgi:hypothetical protein
MTNECSEGFPWPHKPATDHVGPINFLRTTYGPEQPMKPAYGDTVAVKVSTGPHFATFHLPTSALQSTSELFARALKPEWTHDSTRTINLPEVDVALFDMYAQWLATGAEILINEEDWITGYARYQERQRQLDERQTLQRKDKSKAQCLITVWNFDLTTKAWFLGDYLQSRDFQNHCMGHLYYMHQRFDDCERDMNSPSNVEENYWHWGTIAYVNPTDVLYTWEMTEHLAHNSPFVLEQHPLRKFYVDWLARYWDAYRISDWDYEAQDGIVKLIKLCSDLVYKQLQSYTSSKSVQTDCIIRDLGAYWVGVNSYSDDVRRKVERYPETHSYLK